MTRLSCMLVGAAAPALLSAVASAGLAFSFSDPVPGKQVTHLQANQAGAGTGVMSYDQFAQIAHLQQDAPRPGQPARRADDTGVVPHRVSHLEEVLPQKHRIGFALHSPPAARKRRPEPAQNSPETVRK